MRDHKTSEIYLLINTVLRYSTWHPQAFFENGADTNKEKMGSVLLAKVGEPKQKDWYDHQWNYTKSWKRMFSSGDQRNLINYFKLAISVKIDLEPICGYAAKLLRQIQYYRTGLIGAQNSNPQHKIE